MKKKGILFVALLFFLTIAVVYLGYSYSGKQQKELIQATSITAEKEETGNVEKNTEVVDPAAYAEKRDQLSVLDYLKYIGTQDKEPAIAFYGQMPEEETWIENTVSALEAEIKNDVTTTSLTSAETDSYDLYITNAAQSLAETNAAVVFFMMPALGDQVRDISLDDSKDYVARNVTQIQEVLPDTLVVMVTPSPNDRSEEYNSRMLTYTDYKDSAVEVAVENELPLFDLHEAYLSRLESQNLSIEDVLQENGVALNSEGQQLMSELFKEQLSVPVNTTSGLN